MALFFSPGQFTNRAEFYYQLGKLTGAGLVLSAALQQLASHPPAPSYREPIQRLIEPLSRGMTFAESLRSLGSWLPEFDIAILEAGEQSGRLEACLLSLADYYRDRARLARQILGDLAYPAFVFHLAVFIFPFPQLFLNRTMFWYLTQTLGVLLPIYAVIGLIIYATQSRHAERWRAWMESALRPVPILGTARRYLALSRLAATLEALLSAGVTIIEAWELAATASGSPALRRTVTAWRPLVNGGQTPAEALNASGQFPDLFASQYHTGEISGQLDDALKRLHVYFRDEGWRKLHAFTRWSAQGAYLAVALMVGWRVIQFWVGHFNDISKAGGF
jgi:type II secretory pathway component PulF